MSSGADSGPNFLLDWQRVDRTRAALRAGIGSVRSTLCCLACVRAGDSGRARRPGRHRDCPEFNRVTLVLPQRPDAEGAQQRQGGQGSERRGSEAAPAIQERLPPAPAVRAFKPPIHNRVRAAAAGAAHCRTSQDRDGRAPRIRRPALPAVGAPKAPPPPQIQPVEQPKLAFETPGQNGPSEKKGQAKLTPPKASVQDAIRDIARGGGQGGSISVGDLDRPPDLPESIRIATITGHTGSSLELMSDPLGVDFKPYLMQILALVRKNWFAVIPESARLGNRGVAELQFIIDRNGDVPKLVIATPSGSEVAG